MKLYRKSIRINGVLVKSPRFKRSSDAERWYQEKQREKHFTKEGIDLPVDDTITLRQYVEAKWLPERKIKYPKATWYSDEQRFNKYVVPSLGNVRISKITQLQVRTVLKNVVDVYRSSIETRKRVRSLLSKIFNDAMNEQPPLRRDNPAMNISFNDPRTGQKTPVHLKRTQDILKFIKTAKSLGRVHYVYASIALMAGMRKSEILALRWNDFDEDEAELRIDEKFEQASMSIQKGTKSGSEEMRTVPIPDDLVRILAQHKSKSDFQGDEDFILTSEDGSNLTPRFLHTVHESIRDASGVDVTPHGLRHTYGRQFALNDGNMKALQAIMGHSNSATTDLYSKLAGKSVKKHRNVVNFGLGGDDDE